MAERPFCHSPTPRSTRARALHRRATRHRRRPQRPRPHVRRPARPRPRHPQGDGRRRRRAPTPSSCSPPATRPASTPRSSSSPAARRSTSPTRPSPPTSASARTTPAASASPSTLEVELPGVDQPTAEALVEAGPPGLPLLQRHPRQRRRHPRGHRCLTSVTALSAGGGVDSAARGAFRRSAFRGPSRESAPPREWRTVTELRSRLSDSSFFWDRSQYRRGPAESCSVKDDGTAIADRVRSTRAGLGH